MDKYKKLGFQGFLTIEELQRNSSVIPKSMGIYYVLNLKRGKQRFLNIGTGGFFKDKNPNVSILELEQNWIENTEIIYIGKAGSLDGSATLQSRLKQYLNFGLGKKVGHWGGRYIWQIENSQELLICWKILDKEEPRKVEKDHIELFKKEYGKRPFANLTD
ncbi:hypothetical protein [Flavobacterium solisilvae]|uniref:GIY-YIG domain-containing protein n=1 Tax=Flavobacterium solisilvae TaxID=1852019 RepID=A0ABX1QYI5_9FLAO|nr:hypothetical protein [Flavobacterium solisilvae]NMH26249.1 hypothetical protein [Flavobacterium solisilvae]